MSEDNRLKEYIVVTGEISNRYKLSELLEHEVAGSLYETSSGDVGRLIESNDKDMEKLDKYYDCPSKYRRTLELIGENVYWRYVLNKGRTIGVKD